MADFDFGIVGGSIAGSAAACVLVAMGHSVLLIERERHFRDKARGEGIHPWGMDEAEDIGLLPILTRAGATSLPTWINYQDRQPTEQFIWADETARGHAETGIAHPRLQRELLTEAESRGVEVIRPGNLTAISDTIVGHRLELRSERVSRGLNVRVVIGADGSNSGVRKRFGIGAHRDSRHHWLAGLLVEGLNLDPTASHSGLIPGGRLVVLPQGEDRCRVYVALMPDRVQEIQLDRAGRRLIELVARYLPEGVATDARTAGPQVVAGNADIWPEHRSGRGMVLIGDAAGANDPSLGHGMSLTFRDVRELREVVQRHGLDQRGLDEYARHRARYYETLRRHTQWMSRLWLEEGAEADAHRDRYRTARADDPDAGGFSTITSLGPRELVADHAMEDRFFGAAGE